MQKKTLLLTFLACMSIASSCLATTNWISMGPVTLWEYNNGENEANLMNKTGVEHFFDGADIEIYPKAKRVVFTEITKNPSTNGEQISFKRKIIDFREFNINGQGTIKVYTPLEGYYSPQTDSFRVTANNYELIDRFHQCTTWNVLNYTGRYFYPNVLYKEFAALLNLPNLDGMSYTTPKSLGLTWIKSTSEVGVFYYPDSVKTKGNTVTAKIAVWIPSINRIEVINGKFDYDKQIFKPSSAKFYRINTGELVESHTKGLIPGLVGEALHTFRFDEDDSIKIASDFFKNKLAQ